MMALLTYSDGKAEELGGSAIAAHTPTFLSPSEPQASYGPSDLYSDTADMTSQPFARPTLTLSSSHRQSSFVSCYSRTLLALSTVTSGRPPSLVSRLLPELLAQCFLFCAVNEPHTYFPGHSFSAESESSTTFSQSWIKVTHICCLWREVALSHPRLWSVVACGLGQRWMDEALYRSKHAPLVLCEVGDIECWRRDEDYAPAIITSHLSRLEEVTYVCGSDALSVHLLTSALEGQSASLLQTLASTGFVDTDPHEIKALPDLPVLHNIFAHASRLRPICLYGWQFPLDFSATTHLTHCAIGLGDPDYIDSYGKVNDGALESPTSCLS